MRADLFHRPLRETLITDFFGGVSQAEVLPPLLSATSFNESTTSSVESRVDPPKDSQVTGDTQDPITVHIPDETVPANYSSSDDADEMWHPAVTGEGGVIRTVRTWISVLLLTALVGWVGGRK